MRNMRVGFILGDKGFRGIELLLVIVVGVVIVVVVGVVMVLVLVS